MDGNAKIKVIKKGDKPPPEKTEIEYLRGHLLSALHMIDRLFPQEAEKAVEKYRPRRAEAQ
jgi:hypothetical protein